MQNTKTHPNVNFSRLNTLPKDPLLGNRFGGTLAVRGRPSIHVGAGRVFELFLQQVMQPSRGLFVMHPLGPVPHTYGPSLFEFELASATRDKDEIERELESFAVCADPISELDTTPDFNEFSTLAEGIAQRDRATTVLTWVRNSHKQLYLDATEILEREVLPLGVDYFELLRASKLSQAKMRKIAHLVNGA